MLDNVTGRQAARLRHQCDEDVYARQMYCLGMYYNQALLGVEANLSTFPVNIVVNEQPPRRRSPQLLQPSGNRHAVEHGLAPLAQGAVF